MFYDVLCLLGILGILGFLLSERTFGVSPVLFCCGKGNTECISCYKNQVEEEKLANLETMLVQNYDPHD